MNTTSACLVCAGAFDAGGATTTDPPTGLVFLLLPAACRPVLSSKTTRRAATTVHDQVSLPDTLNTPRSSVDPIQQEVLLELLDSFHMR